MRSLHGPVLLAALALASLALPRTASANCGAEGCPLSPHGPEATFGRFVFGVRYQFVEQNMLWNGSGEISPEDAHEDDGEPHELEQLTRTRSWNVDARANLGTRLQLALTVPYLDRIHRHTLEHHPGAFYDYEWHMTGIGDATAFATWAVMKPSGPGGSLLVVLAGAKLPTGETDAPLVLDEQPEPPARLGSGSTDYVAGAQFTRTFGTRSLSGEPGMLPLSLGVSGRLNGVGTENYQSGDEWQADLGCSYPVVRWMRVLAQVNASGHAKDDVGDTDAEPHHTGGETVFASPGLQADLLPGVSAYGYYQFRLYQHTNGTQLVSPYHLVFGLGYTPTFGGRR